MSVIRVEDLLKYMQLSFSENHDQHILDFAEAVNKQFQNSLAPGSYLTLDEPMINLFHRNLEGKIKIIRN